MSKPTEDSAGDEGMRLDQWLHAARFFKTRALAARAVKTHRVLLADARIKPARLVRVGDRLTVVRGEETFELQIRGLSARRGPAREAVLLYEETAASVARREHEAALRRHAGYHAPAPDRRPDKRARRHLIRFLRDEPPADD